MNAVSVTNGYTLNRALVSFETALWYELELTYLLDDISNPLHYDNRYLWNLRDACTSETEEMKTLVRSWAQETGQA